MLTVFLLFLVPFYYTRDLVASRRLSGAVARLLFGTACLIGTAEQ